MSFAAMPSSFAATRQNVFAVHFLDQGAGVELAWQVAPALVFGQEPQVMALEWVRGLIVPVLHQVFAVVFKAASAIVEFAFHALDDVANRCVDPLAL